jgi:hypothetical protein
VRKEEIEMTDESGIHSQEEVERFRQAALARNRSFIRTNLMQRPEEPLPAAQVSEE